MVPDVKSYEEIIKNEEAALEILTPHQLLVKNLLSESKKENFNTNATNLSQNQNRFLSMYNTTTNNNNNNNNQGGILALVNSIQQQQQQTQQTQQPHSHHNCQNQQ